MCNLYTYKLSAWEVRNLLEHRNLIGTNYPPTEVFPDYEAPVITAQADGTRAERTMRWGFPEFPGERGVRTNVRYPKSAPWSGKFEVASRCIVPVARSVSTKTARLRSPSVGLADQTGSRSFSPGHGCLGRAHAAPRKRRLWASMSYSPS